MRYLFRLSAVSGKKVTNRSEPPGRCCTRPVIQPQLMKNYIKDKDSLILGSLLFAVAVILGTVVTIAIEKLELHLDVVANLAVAAGTIGLAYFTWESVSSTKTVLAAEDRRHQVGFAPLVVCNDVRAVGVEVHADLQNVGTGMARNVAVYIPGVWFSNQLNMYVAPAQAYPDEARC